MSVKAETAFDVCWEVYRGAREILETKRGSGRAGLAAGCKILVAAGPAAEVEGLGGGFCVGGAGGVGGAGVEDGDVSFVLFGIGGVREGTAFFGIE